MDTAECQGVVGQRILFSVVTGKRNMSKVIPGLGWCQNSKSVICHMTVNDSMVVRTCKWLTKPPSAKGRGGCISPFGFHSWLPDC